MLNLASRFLERPTLISVDGLNRIIGAAESYDAASAKPVPATTNELLLIEGNTATITINGVLAMKPSAIEKWLFGAVSIDAVQQAVASANDNPNVNRIDFLFDSPGGDA